MRIYGASQDDALAESQRLGETDVQARLQMQAAYLMLPFERLPACGRDIGAATVAEVEWATDPADLAARSQLVVTTTPSREPVVDADWLHPGLLITAMGSDQPKKNEIDLRTLAAADLYICDLVSQCETAGEFEAALAAGLWNSGTPPDLGQIIAGKYPGRTSDEAVAICDLTGTGAQDTAVATHAHATMGDAEAVIST